MNEVSQNVEFVQSFTGYNHNLRCNQGQFYDMKNMTGDYAPVLSTRSLRTQLLVLQGAPQALFCKDYVYYIQGGNIIWGMTSGTTWVEKGRLTGVVASTGKKQIADIGAKVLIMPDKKVLNVSSHTISDATFTHEDNSWTRIVDNVSYTTYGKIKLTPCTMDGATVSYTAQSTAPSDTTVYWLNTGDKSVYQYSISSETWQKLASVYVKVEPVLEYDANVGPGTDAQTWLNAVKTSINGLNDYDTVNLTLEDFVDTYGVIGGDEQIFHVGDGFFVIAGIVASATSYGFTLKTQIPSMAYITSLNNRIWGCSSDGREIYACKLGDPTQWYNFAGLSSDSYAATVGSDGEFTGAAAYNNTVLFFKKDRMHKVMGTLPSNFQLAEYAVNGVASGSANSLCVVNGYLFYLGEERVMIYDGSLPQSCSDAFGDLRLHDGIAGQQMNKYYLSGKDAGNTYFHMVYDTETGQWWKEDDAVVEMSDTYFNNLYSVNYVKNDEGNMVHVLTKEVGSYEGIMDWFVETGDLGLDSPFQKYITRVQLRMAFTGSMYVDIAYNGGLFERLYQKTSSTLTSYTVPIAVKRCDHFRLRIGGKGVAKIYSMGYNVESGSEIC